MKKVPQNTNPGYSMGGPAMGNPMMSNPMGNVAIGGQMGNPQ